MRTAARGYVNSPTLMKSCLKSKKDDKSSSPEVSASSESTTAREITWNQIQVIEFPIILGDNPSCLQGVPITIGWQPQQIKYLDVDYYELYQKKPSLSRRSYYTEANHYLKLSPSQRIDL